jgi:pyruvate dehydrogenase E1 component beta subunit
MLAPFEVQPLVESVQRTGNLLVVEEGTLSFGWGAEIIAVCSEAPELRLSSARRLAARETPIPASSALEASTLPDQYSIVNSCLEIVHYG